MKIEHGDAVTIELIVRRVFECDRGGLGGYVNADVFEHNPMDAVALCVAKLYHGYYDNEIDEFVSTWRPVFRYPEENEGYTAEMFIDEFSNLIALLKS